MSKLQVANVPAMSTPEFYNQLIQHIKHTAPLQPVNECKVIRVVTFMVANTSRSEAASSLTVPFPVQRVKYSIVARPTGGYSADVLTINCSLTNDIIGCVSDVQTDLTQTQTHEFIYPSLRMFDNERLTVQLYNTPTVSTTAPTNFTGVITLILELSNY